jgi:hypothetical protein
MIHCFLPSDHMTCGETALCLLRGKILHGGANQHVEKSIMFAQILGYISIDFRWINSSKNIKDHFLDASAASIEKIHLPSIDPLPVMPNHASCCVFSTSRIAISPTHIYEGGTFLEFDIPHDALPSFKGLCATVSYFLTINVQFPTTTETLTFPFFVQGVGSPTLPFQAK